MFRRTSHTVASTNGVELVTYRYDHSVSDGSGVGNDAMQPILFSHATGFHGRVFSPVAAHLSDFSCTTFDYRGYGDTAPPSRLATRHGRASATMRSPSRAPP